MAKNRAFAICRGKIEGDFTLAPCGSNTLDVKSHVRGFVVHPNATGSQVLLEWKYKDYSLSIEELVAALRKAEKLSGCVASVPEEAEVTLIWEDGIGGNPPAREFIFGEVGRHYVTCCLSHLPKSPVTAQDLPVWLDFARRFGRWVEGRQEANEQHRLYWEAVRRGESPEGEPPEVRVPNFWDRHDPHFLDEEKYAELRRKARARGETIVQITEQFESGGGNRSTRGWVEDLDGNELSFDITLKLAAADRLKGVWVQYSGEYFNRNKGTHWSVTGNGDGTATGWVMRWPNSCPSYTEGKELYEAHDDGVQSIVVNRLGFEGHLATRAAAMAAGLPLVQQHGLSRRCSDRAWVEDMQGRILDHNEVARLVADHRLTGEWAQYSGEQFNRDKGVHLKVTGNGDGKALVAVASYPDACPSEPEVREFAVYSELCKPLSAKRFDQMAALVSSVVVVGLK